MTEACGWCCLVGSGSPAVLCPGLCMDHLPRSHCCPPRGLPALDWHNRGKALLVSLAVAWAFSLFCCCTACNPTGTSTAWEGDTVCRHLRAFSEIQLLPGITPSIFFALFSVAREQHSLAEAISYNSPSERGYDKQKEQKLQKHSSWQNLSAKLTQVSTVSYAETLTEKYDADLLITGLVNTKKQLPKTFILQVTLKKPKSCIYIIITNEYHEIQIQIQIIPSI